MRISPSPRANRTGTKRETEKAPRGSDRGSPAPAVNASNPPWALAVRDLKGYSLGISGLNHTPTLANSRHAQAWRPRQVTNPISKRHQRNTRDIRISMVSTSVQCGWRGPERCRRFFNGMNRGLRSRQAGAFLCVESPSLLPACVAVS